MTKAGIISAENTLRKIGAHLRWQLEKCGVDAEKQTFVIVVSTDDERDAIVAGFERDFDQGSMSRGTDTHRITVHGVNISVVVQAKVT
jgi:hypothetical protein